MPRRFSFVKHWLPVVIWMALIFVGSTNLLSSERTSRVIGPFLRWLKPDISEETVQRVQFALRKCGHVAEYAVLSVLLWRAIRQPPANDSRSWDWSYMGWAFLWATLYAVTDEFHQSLVGTRFASAWDVGFDALGAVFGLGWIRWSRRKRFRD